MWIMQIKTDELFMQLKTGEKRRKLLKNANSTDQLE